MNKYDLEHVVSGHARMSQEQWEGIYREAWDLYYTLQHMKTVMRRAAACGVGAGRLAAVLFFFSASVGIEGIHPLQGGVLRRKFRTDRRPGLPLEPAWSFYPKRALEILSTNGKLLARWLKFEALRRKIKSDPLHRAYTDLSLTPVTNDEEETLEPVL